jgi:L-asparaginase II
MSNDLPVLAEVTRGPILESFHRGVIVAAEPDGRIITNLGDSNLITSTRSTIKPLQAIPVILSGAADRFQMTPREVALLCASHEGESFHTETVTAMLARIGLDESALLCGAHPPFDVDTARQLERDGIPFSQIHNNCSGKHTGMLATAVHLGIGIENYTARDHPVQKEIISIFTRIAGLDEQLPTGIDGCSAPTFGVPLDSLAVAFARLVSPQSATLDTDTAEAAKRIVAAMIAHPEMVGGTKRFDTALLRAGRGKLICKIGAEAVYGIGVLPGKEFPRGLGIAIKMEDGSYRGLGPVVVETLVQLGLLDDAQQSELAYYHKPEIDNRRGLKVGQVQTVFNLDFDKQTI